MLRRRTFFQGRGIRGEDVTDILWLDPDGQEMTDAAWNAPHVRCLGVMLVGDAIAEVDERGEPVHDDTLLVLLNAGETAVAFTLPAGADRPGVGTRARHERRRPASPGPASTAPGYELGSRSLAVLRLG